MNVNKADDKINLPEMAAALERLFNLILDKNKKLMSQIFILMFKAKKNKADSITLTLDDIEKLEKSLVSPKDIYLNIVGNIPDKK